MAGATTTLTLEQFSDRMNETAGRLAGVSFLRPLKVCKVLVVADVKENFAGSHGPDGQPWKPLGRPRARGGDRPLRDRGLLMASITSANGRGHVEQITDTTLVLGTNLECARLHQEGGTITPKRAKALTIPLTREAANAGGARNFPRPLFVFRGKAGSSNAFLAESKGKGKKSKLVFHYLLSKRVVIPARPFLGFSAKVVEQITAVFRDFLGGLAGGDSKAG